MNVFPYNGKTFSIRPEVNSFIVFFEPDTGHFGANTVEGFDDEGRIMSTDQQFPEEFYYSTDAQALSNFVYTYLLEHPSYTWPDDENDIDDEQENELSYTHEDYLESHAYLQ